ncbi:hypothetical protein F4678DRAFT_389231 [Xylaria arbuscula]|nr:hypothetical protein F4678DRAFT_389231 [Xylaria arbuscula]
MKIKTIYMLVLVDIWGFTTASFHNSFNNVTLHDNLLLEWDHADATDYPLVVHVQVLNITSDHKVNTFETDISSESGAYKSSPCLIDNSTAGLTDDSFLWNDLPYPLPFLPTATYEIQVLRQIKAVNKVSDPIASSTTFAILPENEDTNDNSGWQTTNSTSTSDPSESAISAHSDRRPSNSTTLAAGLVVPIIVGISVVVFLCMYRRRKRTLEERRKERQTLVID